MIRQEVFRQNVDDTLELATLIDIAVQDMYQDGVPSIEATVDYLMADEDEAPV